MFIVLENEKPCNCFNFPEVDSSWSKTSFDTFEEAKTYAINWLGPWGSVMENAKPNEKVVYYINAWVEIREVN